MKSAAIDRSMTDAIAEQWVIRDRQAVRMNQNTPSEAPSRPRAGRTSVMMLLLIVGCGLGWTVGTGRLVLPEFVRAKLGGADTEFRYEYREMMLNLTPDERKYADTYEQFAQMMRRERGLGF